MEKQNFFEKTYQSFKEKIADLAKKHADEIHDLAKKHADEIHELKKKQDEEFNQLYQEVGASLTDEEVNYIERRFVEEYDN